MAKTLKEMPRVKRPGRSVKYPYEEWLEMAKKAPTQLTKGEDFDVEIKTMRHNIYRHSKLRNLSVETVTLGNENDEDASIVIRVTSANTTDEKK